MTGSDLVSRSHLVLKLQKRWNKNLGKEAESKWKEKTARHDVLEIGTKIIQ